MTTTDTGKEPPIPDTPWLACDCHMHIFGPLEKYPYFAGRIYTPPEAPLESYLETREKLGLQRTVVVQPSVYGTDNSCQKDAVAAIPGARGVAVVSDDAPDAEIDALHKAGFRGLRINLVQGSVNEPIEKVLERVGARLRDIGWHLQIFTKPDILASVEKVLARFPVPVMLDHFSDMSVWKGPSQPGFDVVHRLLKDGPCWMKLSAAYHHPQSEGGHDKARGLVSTLLESAPGRLVWGSNWPHPQIPPRKSPTEAPSAPFREIDDAGMLSLLVDWAGDKSTLKRILVDNPAKFYDF